MMAVSPRGLLEGLHYVYPILVYVYFLASTILDTCAVKKPASGSAIQHPRRSLITYMVLGVAATYAVQCVLVLAYWRPIPEDLIVSLVACAMIFTLEFVILHDLKDPVWHPYTGSFAIALVFEPVMAVLSLIWGGYQLAASAWILDTLAAGARLACLILAVVVYFTWHKRVCNLAGSDSEQQPLLRKPLDGDSEDTLVTEYGSTTTTETDSPLDKTSSAKSSSTKEPESEWERSQRRLEENRDKRLQESGSWLTYAKSFKLFLPYVWPVNDRGLQVHAALVGLCLLANNVLNVLIPNQLGVVTKSLTQASGPEAPSDSWNPWVQVLIFAGLKLSASEAGIALIRKRLWLPVEQYSERAVAEAAHSHILRLDASFHDTKSLSDMVMAIQHGESIGNLLETICFDFIPKTIDLAVAFIYLTVKFGPWEGLITISTSTVFIYLSTCAIARSREAHQVFSKAWYEEWYIMNSSISGWTTVASFNQVGYESNRYARAVRDKLSKSRQYTLQWLSSHAIQYLVLLAGLLAGLFLAVWKVTKEHTIDASDFVVLLTYWSQLVAPLNFFAMMGKNVNRNLIDAERLLEILETEPKIVNKPNAKPFRFKAGHVRFQNVHFSYDKKKEILKDVSFTVEPGQTIAFVGQTGAGKSTILKLLNRFYDVTGGNIKIDDQDVRDVDLYSLRASIGVVPQNPVLFNDSVMDNVRYARLDATDEEVHDACKAAAIHDQIIGFSDGYNTRVGERGMKLSGGELQRIAVARAILKQPKIVLLDEATSAIDTETEAKIQEALSRLCKNRTTFIVAHRLSTIVNADRILVVNDGRIMEQGTHESLISSGGKYAELWSKQVFVRPKGQDSEISDDHAGTSKKNDESEDRQAAQVTTPVGHKREGSKLNPDAPEFTPRSLLAANSAAYSPIGKTTSAGHDPFSQTITPIHIKQPSSAVPIVYLPQPVGLAKDRQAKEQQATVGSVDDGQQSSETSAAGQPAIKPKSDREIKPRKVSYKIPRYTRRNQSRSEPSDSRTNTS